MKKIVIAIVILGACTAGLGLVWLFYLGSVGPEIYVVSGQQITKAQSAIIEELGLLDDSERIRFFYSDALTDIKEGMYLVTDRKLVLYNENWVEPRLVAPFASIKDVQLDRNESFFEDSLLNVMLENGETWTLPLSSERGNDKVFYEYLASKIR